ncbi:MAG: NUDIX hydrolase [Pseudonocardiaceae bacterium]|nr:NUDIX hydrolase [Pseudonocardiaceae bacterium]
MTIPLPAALAVLIVLVAVAAAVRAASRLDRLHARTDAAWVALDGALVRRATVVRTLATAGELPADSGAALRAAASAATAGRDREIAENERGRALGGLDRGELSAELATELADAEARVVIARRVYNDAVRDTRALRSRRAVRWLRLAGTAAWPRYFEIAEPTTGPPGLPRHRTS